MKKETQICKHCKSEIPAGAKICPNCRKKQSGKLKWIILAIVILCVVGAITGGSEDGASKMEATTEKKKVEYQECSVDQMMRDLEDNAASASETYKGKYLKITGRLGNIDSDMAYIGLYPDDDLAITGVQCYIQNDKQEEAVKKMSKGDEVTLKGKCTDVGEVLGYSLDIEEIK